MTLRLSPAAWAATALLGFTALAAHADVTITYTTNVDSSEMRQAMKKATPELRKRIAAQGYGKPQTVKTYVHSGTMRTDIGTRSTVINTTAHEATSFDRKSHTYLGQPFDPKPAPAGSPQPHVSVKDTGKSIQFLGHTVRVYTMTVTPPQGPGSMTGEIWAAKDIARPPFDPLINNPASPLAPEMKKVAGMPLKVVMQMNGPNGTSTMSQVATSISTQPVQASLFAVPSGYKKVTPPTPQQMQMMQQQQQQMHK